MYLFLYKVQYQWWVGGISLSRRFESSGRVEAQLESGRRGKFLTDPPSLVTPSLPLGSHYSYYVIFSTAGALVVITV